MPNSESPLSSLLGRKLLSAMLFISLGITLISSSTVLWLEYRLGIKRYDQVLEQIQNSYQNSLSYSLWGFDNSQIESQLKGILNFPGITHAQIDNGKQVQYSDGNFYKKADKTFTIPLNYEYENRKFELGSLRIRLSYSDLYNHLLVRGIEIIITQLLLIFSVSILIILAINKIITKRLQKMANWANEFNLENLEIDLIIDDENYERDELNRVADAINQMRFTLISDLKSREESSYQNFQLQEQLKMAIDNAAIGFCLFDVKINRWSCNSHFSSQMEINSLKLEEMQNPMTYFMERITPEGRKKYKEILDSILNGNSVTENLSVIIPNLRGNDRHFDLSIQSINFRASTPTQVMICMVDKSEEFKAKKINADTNRYIQENVYEKTKELSTENRLLTAKIDSLQEDLAIFKSSQQSKHMHMLSKLLSQSIKKWQNNPQVDEMTTWLKFLKVDLKSPRTGIDFVVFIKAFLSEIAEKKAITIDFHMPFSLIVEEIQEPLEFFVNLLLNDHILAGAKHLHTTLTIESNSIEHEWILTNPTLDDDFQQRLESKLCLIFVKLRYNGHLEMKKNGEQLIMQLSIPFSA